MPIQESQHSRSSQSKSHTFLYGEVINPDDIRFAKVLESGDIIYADATYGRRGSADMTKKDRDAYGYRDPKSSRGGPPGVSRTNSYGVAA